MKIKAKQAMAVSAEEAETRLRIARVIVERSPFYGYRLIKKALRFARGTPIKGFKIEGVELRDKPSKARAFGYAANLRKELYAFRDTRAGRLLDFPSEILWQIEKDLGKVRCAQRYGNSTHLDGMFAEPELEDERDIKLSKRQIESWVKLSKKKQALRKKQERKLGIAKAVTKKVAKRKRTRMKPITGLQYVKALKAQAAQMENTWVP